MATTEFFFFLKETLACLPVFMVAWEKSFQEAIDSRLPPGFKHWIVARDCWKLPTRVP